MNTVVKELKNKLTFENLFNYFFEIYKIGGTYREIEIQYTNFEGNEYVTIKPQSNFRSMHPSSLSLYKVMNGDNPMREENVVRLFDDEGNYSGDESTVSLQDMLDYFNKRYKDVLRKDHQIN